MNAAYGISMTERKSTFESAAAGFSSPIKRMVTLNASISFLTLAISCIPRSGALEKAVNCIKTPGYMLAIL